MALVLCCGGLGGRLPAIAADVEVVREPHKVDSILTGILAEYEKRIQAIAAPEAPLEGLVPAGVRDGEKITAPEEPASGDEVPGGQVRQDASEQAAAGRATQDAGPEAAELAPSDEQAAYRKAARQEAAREAASQAPMHEEDSVAVTFHVKSAAHAEALAKFLSDNGGSPRNWGEDYVEAYVPVWLLGEASRQPGVLRTQAMVPPRPFFGPIVSEGRSVHKALAWHSVGFKGQGVKVGVIDLGFDGITSPEILGAELPANITARCYTSVGIHTSNLSDCMNQTQHGTAVAEAVMDIAPDVSLYVSQPQTRADTRDAADWMAQQGVQVINFSVGYPFDGPGDGTSPFSISLLNTVDAAVRQGVFWATAAGNAGAESWFGPFKDSNDDGWHEFQADSTDRCNPVDILGKAFIWLRWKDNWGNATSDLDLHIYLSSSGADVSSSESRQDGSDGAIPFESAEATSSRGACLAIKHIRGPVPAWVQLGAWDIDGFGHRTYSGSIGNPAESANPGHLAVGAAPADNTNVIESFSSRGPTPDGRIMPDLVGVDRGNSRAFGRWTGTSQASPHVAGLAAIALSGHPDYTPQQVAAFLTGNAKDRGIGGRDNDWGEGLAQLPEPPSDANLVSLSLSPGTLSPTFHEGISSYRASLAGTVAQVTVTATASPDAASFEISPADASETMPGHQVNLSQGSNDIFLRVTGNSGARRTYLVRVVRGSDSVDLTDLQLSQGKLDPSFSRGVTDYATRVGDDRTASRVTVTAAPSDADATVVITPVDADSLSAGHQASLSAGANTISVQVTSPDGMVSKTYRIQATRAATPANHAPTANAGMDQMVEEDTTVTLAGGGTDPEGETLSYRWHQHSGPTVRLNNARARNASFRAPNLLANATLEFLLWVNDGLQDSIAPDLVQITVLADDDPPTADAGSDIVAATGSTVTLDGSSSSDPEGQNLASFAWMQTGGPTVSLSGDATVQATFQTPSMDADLTFQLVVGDGNSNSAPDSVTITVDSTVNDYDVDEDGLVEIGTLSQLNAMRFDGDADGEPHGSHASDYLAVFENPATGMGCPVGVCKGYELDADLDLDVAPYNVGEGWVPIIYKGIFQGNGHRIANLYINRPEEEDPIGLFNRLLPGARVEGVKLVNANVYGRYQVGALVGINQGIIDGCSVTGNVTGSDSSVGGLAGNNQGSATIIASSAAAIVTASSYSAGGLVGESYGSIVASYAGGVVRGNYKVGGLAGSVYGGNITASYATGQVIGVEQVGGLIGNIHTDSLSAGTRITASYARGLVVGHIDGIVGGLAGISSGSTTSASYWDTETSNQLTSMAGDGKTTSELQSPLLYGSATSSPPSIYAGWNLDLDGDGDPNDPWDFGSSSQYPVLKYGGLNSAGQFAAQGSPSAAAALSGLSLAAGGDSVPLGPAFDADTASYGANVAIDQTRVTLTATPAQAGATVQIVPGDVDSGTNGHQLDLTSRRTVVGIAVTEPGGGATRIYGLRIARGGHDGDLDGLIEISTAAQLRFLEWDPYGEGKPRAGKLIEQKRLFPNVQDGRVEGLLCPTVCFGYELTTDLDLDVAPYNSGTGWPSIAAGSDENAYRGIFDGNGHEIANLFVDRPQEAGLFGRFYGRVKRLRLTNVNVSANRFSGGLAGYIIHGGTASSVSVTGTVRGNYGTGGLAGANDGTIEASYADANVLGNTLVGGLVGRNIGTIVATYALGNVQGNTGVGGLAGTNVGFIEASYAAVTVIGNLYVGGLAGWGRDLETGTVDSSYWDIQTTGQRTSYNSLDSAGKITADLQSPIDYAGTIYDNWNLDLDGDGDDDDPWHFGTTSQYPVLKYGGLDAGRQFAAQVLTPDTELSTLGISPGVLSSAFDSATRTYIGIVARSQTQTTVTALARNPQASIRIFPPDADPYTDGYQVGLAEGFNHIIITVTSPDGISQRSYLISLIRGAQDTDFDGLIEISSVEQLNAVRWDLNGNGEPDFFLRDSARYAEAFSSPTSGAICPGGCTGYELIRDLDLNVFPYNQGVGWTPIGHEEHQPFVTIFEGNGRRISNLFIDNSSLAFAGLFGSMSGDLSHTEIRRLSLENVNITVSGAAGELGAAGGLIGFNSLGVVIASSVTGSINGGQFNTIGGLIGSNQGTISASWAKVNVQASFAGGLAGINFGTINASYAAGNATGGITGGLVGGNYGGSIAASYAIGAVAPAIPAASVTSLGLVGDNLGSVTNSYWNTETSNQPTSAAGVGKTTAQLQSPLLYGSASSTPPSIYAGWNLDLDGDGNPDDPWDFGSASQYPALKYLSGSLGLAAQDPSRDATLSALGFDPPLLSSAPAFSPRIVDYAGVVDHKLRSMTVRAAPVRSGASASILPADLDGDAGNGHQIALNGEDQVALAVQVTAQDGMTALTYRATLSPDSEPVFTDRVPDQIWRVGEQIPPLTLPLATGGDGTLTYALEPPPPRGLTLAGRVLSGAPESEQPYSTYAWMATDADDDLAGTVFGVLVEQPNRAPVPVGQMADLELIVGASETVDLAGRFRDPDGDEFEHSATTGDPAVATAQIVDGNALQVAGRGLGATRVIVTATDIYGLSGEQSFWVSVGNVVNFAGDASAPEGGVARLSLELGAPLESDIVLGYRLGADGDPATADADSDDWRLPGQDAAESGETSGEARGEAAIAAGETGALIEIAILDDAEIEPPRERFVATLEEPDADGLALGPRRTATVTIEEGLCDRTAGVRDALRGERDCSQIDDRDLAARTLLDLTGRGIETLQTRDFMGLSRLNTLRLSGNRLGAWPAGALDGLSELAVLRLDDNELAELPAGAFAGPAGLRILDLSGNSLAEWPAAPLGGLSELVSLRLGGNALAGLPHQAFAEAPKLFGLHLQNNALAELPAEAFAGLPALMRLDLSGNALDELPEGLLAGLEGLMLLRLDGNRLQALPAGLFEGLPDLRELHLQENPGAPFPLILEAMRVDSEDRAAPGPAELSLSANAGAPFELRAELSADGGALSATTAVLPPGRSASDLLSATPEDEQATMVVRVGEVSEVPERRCGEFLEYACFQGLEVLAGDPLVLFNAAPAALGGGIRDRTALVGERSSFDLMSLFSDRGGEALTYRVKVDDPALARVRIEDGKLYLTPLAEGMVRVTITATDPHGQKATLSFALKVERTMRGRYQGWRVILLKPNQGGEGS